MSMFDKCLSQIKVCFSQKSGLESNMSASSIRQTDICVRASNTDICLSEPEQTSVRLLSYLGADISLT